MRTNYAIVVLVIGLLPVAGPVQAVKAHVDVTPANAKQTGFVVTSKPDENGVVTITVYRDPEKVLQRAPDTGIKTEQFATLSIYSEDGFVAECVITPTTTEIDGNDRSRYWFRISRDHIKHSSLTIAEIDDYSDLEGGREHLIGGGTFFEFQLSDFIVK